MAARARSFYDQNRNIILSYIMMLVLLTVVSILRPGFGFGDPRHLRALALQASVIGLVSMGQTLVIISGGADLSVPWTVAGTAVLMTILTEGNNDAMIWAIPLALVGAAIVGLINGIGIAYFEISPIIMTLAMNSILLGLVSGYGLGGVGTQGQYGQPPPLVITLGSERFGEIPYLIIIMVVLTIFLTILLSYTGFGRSLYAIGTNPTVAEYSGINVRRVRVLLWVFVAVLNGIAGIILAGKFGRAYLGMGDPYLFMSVTAVIVGGASILGGTGNYLGTIGGAMLLAVLTALLPVLYLPRSIQLVIQGGVILIAVFFATNRFALIRFPRRMTKSGSTAT